MKAVLTILFSLAALTGFGQTRISLIKGIESKQSKADSLKGRVTNIKASANLIKDSVANLPSRHVSSQTDGLASAEQMMTKKVDSLKFRLKKDQAHLKSGTGANWTDSLTSDMGNAAKSNLIEDQVNTIEESSKALQGNIETPISNNLSKFSKGGASGMQGLDIPTPSFSIGTDANLDLPELKTGKVNLDKSFALPDNITSKTDIKSQSVLPVAKTALDTDLPESLEQPISSVTGNLPQNEVLQLQQVKPESLTEEVKNIAAVRNANSQLSEAERAKQYFDPQVAKEEAVNKVKLEAVNHFSGHEQEIMAAIQLLSDAKSKVPGTDQIVDPFASRSNSFKDIPTLERFVPGFTIQIQRSQSLWFDLNPAMGFRASSRITAGAGWNYRVAYFFNEKRLDQSARCFGVRTFIHFRINGLLSLKADIEGMKVAPEQFVRVNSELDSRKWVWGCFFGAKKDFSLGKRLSGNVQMVYNVLRTDNLCPYVHKFNVRMGIDLPLYKKKNQINTESRTDAK